MSEKNERIMGIVWLCIALAVAVLGGYPLYQQRKDKPLPIAIPKEAVSHWLSEWAPWLKGTEGDTRVFVIASSDATPENSGSILIIGGTHPDEPAAFISALIAISNTNVQKGRVFIVPQDNRSAFSATEPGEGHPPSYTILLGDGSKLTLPFGARLTNPLDQWPTPDVRPHNPSGQLLSGKDLRNLNRCFPGDSSGLYTERVAAGITSLIRKEKIDLTVDLHEASLEYPVINALVAHEKSLDLASAALMALDEENLKYSFEPSPQKLRGLTHRELGDHTDSRPILVETANVAQGRLRGKTTNEMVVEGYDAAYEKAVKTGLLKVNYPPEGIPLEVRCGRHLSAVVAYIDAWNDATPDRPLVVTGIPRFTDLKTHSVGYYLHSR